MQHISRLCKDPEYFRLMVALFTKAMLRVRFPVSLPDGKVKIANNTQVSTYVARLLKAMEGNTDSRVYSIMQAFCHSLKPRIEPRDVAKRINERVMTVNHILRSIKYTVPPNAAILDVGCNDGSIARAIGDYYGTADVSGVDLLPDDKPYPIKYKRADGDTYPFPDESFDIITAFVTLHHVKCRGHIESIKRMLKPDGVLIIREHDCRDVNTAAYLEVVHGVNETILENKSPEAFHTDHYAAYTTREETDAMFKELTPVFYSTYQVANNPQRLYHAAYVKNKPAV